MPAGMYVTLNVKDRMHPIKKCTIWCSQKMEVAVPTHAHGYFTSLCHISQFRGVRRNFGMENFSFFSVGNTEFFVSYATELGILCS